MQSPLPGDGVDDGCKITGGPAGQFTDYRGKAGDASESEMVGEFKKIYSDNHNPDAECDDAVFCEGMLKSVRKLFHNVLPVLIVSIDSNT